jgi:hypothetical protein
MARQQLADGVYVAVPLPKRSYKAPHVRDMQTLCRRLELGLIFVGFSATGVAQVDVAVHPREATRPKVDKKRRLAVIREHESRTGSVNTGGVTRQKILTAYKEQALQVAKLLRDNGPQQSETLRKLGGPENTAAILRRNVLKWFVRVETLDNGRHVYNVTEAGLEALRQYEELL